MNNYQQAGYNIDVEEKMGSVVVINVGPSHPATHGTLRLVIEMEGETIRNLDQELGFLHTGFEKLGETHSYNQFITVTDRMNYISPLNNNIGFAIAVEKLLEIQVPIRAQLIRVIMAELSRIADHIICVGLQGMDLGAFSVFLWTFVEREKLYDIFETVTGARLTTSYTRIGGLAFDVPGDFRKRVNKVLKSLEKGVQEVELMLNKNKIFINRCQNIGYLSKEDALNYGVTGPIIRASGVNYDVRKDLPYSSYDQFDFDVPVETAGDSYARYLVRIQEMYQSIRIIKQALRRLEPGEVNFFNKKNVLPSKNMVYNDMEALIHHFKLIMPGSSHGIGVPLGEVYSSTESPNGELGFYIVSDGKSSAYRLRIRPPSLFNYQCLDSMLKGHLMSDIPSVLSTLNVIAGELDR